MVERREADSAKSDQEFGSIDLAVRYERISDPQSTHGRDLIGLLALNPSDRVLDIGCGTGALAALAAERLTTGGKVVGIDPAPPRIDVAQRLADERLEFLVGRAEDLSSFGTSDFDVVYMNSVLNSLPDRLRALTEAHRVLRPGGRIGIATTIRDRPNELWRLVRMARDVAAGLSAGEVAERDQKRAPKRSVSGREVEELLQNAGFHGRISELRTYIASFRDVAQIVEFLQATTYDTLLPGSTQEGLQRFCVALDRVLAEMVPPERCLERIRLERYVLLAVADKSE